MKQLLMLFIILITCIGNTNAQVYLKWSANLSLGFQYKMHLNEDENISIYNIKPFSANEGIVQYSLSLKRHFKLTPKMNIAFGAGLSREMVLYRVGIAHCDQSNPDILCTAIFYSQTGYTVSSLQLQTQLGIELFKNLNVNIELMPNFKFHHNAPESYTRQLTFDFHFLEVYPEIEYRIKKVSLGLGYRILNIRKFDPVYISYDSTKPSKKNPMKLMFYTAYHF